MLALAALRAKQGRELSALLSGQRAGEGPAMALDQQTEQPEARAGAAEGGDLGTAPAVGRQVYAERREAAANEQVADVNDGPDASDQPPDAPDSCSSATSGTDVHEQGRATPCCLTRRPDSPESGARSQGCGIGDAVCTVEIVAQRISDKSTQKQAEGLESAAGLQPFLRVEECSVCVEVAPAVAMQPCGHRLCGEQQRTCLRLCQVVLSSQIGIV